jgi:hypothetical protein
VHLEKLAAQPQNVAQVPLVAEVVDLLNVAPVGDLERLDQVEVVLPELALLDVKKMGADARCAQPRTAEGQVFCGGNAENVVVAGEVAASQKAVNFQRGDQGDVA